MRLSIEPVLEKFPQYRAAVLVVEDLTVSADRGAELEADIAHEEKSAADRFNPEELGALQAVSDWRRAYREFGIKQTKYRASVERLLRSAVKGRGLPRINRPVDAYNLISLRHLAPVGADDLDQVSGDISFRFATGDESFLPLGKEDLGEDPPKPGEVILADEAKVLCRRWNWYQDARSCITGRTTRAVLTIQSLGSVNLEAAAADLDLLLRRECGAQVAWRIADTDTPVAEFP